MVLAQTSDNRQKRDYNSAGGGAACISHNWFISDDVYYATYEPGKWS